MSMKNTISHLSILSALVFICACSSGSQVHVATTSVTKGSLVVHSLNRDKVIFQKDFDSISDLGFARAEVNLGDDDLRVEIVDSATKQSFSAVVPKDFNDDSVDVNAVTTISSCLLNKYQNTSQTLSVTDLIKKSNKVAQTHFGVGDILSLQPNMDFKDVQAVTTELRYGLVLQAFDEAAKEYGSILTTQQFLVSICDDLVHDNYLNGIGSNGFILLPNKKISDQTLKADFAGVLYRVFISKIPNLDSANIFDQANVISTNSPPDLFDPNSKSYFFENEPPEPIVWAGGIPPAPGHDTTLDFHMDDQMNAPVTITVNVVFTSSGNSYPITNELPSQNYFYVDAVTAYFTENGDATIKIVGLDPFGNRRESDYQGIY